MAVVIGGIFTAGYMAGSLKPGKVDKTLVKIEGIKSEMAGKIAGLERDVRSLRARMNIFTARQHLSSSVDQLRDRNFGKAEKELASARSDLRTASRLIPDKTGRTLSKLGESIDSIIDRIRRSDPLAHSELKNLQSHLDDLINPS